MTIEHRNIQEAGLHEPKGVSTATAGQVYTADGLGSGTHKLPQIQNQATGADKTNPFNDGAGGISWETPRTGQSARMSIFNNTTAIAVTAGTASLHSEADYIKVAQYIDGPTNGTDVTLNADSTLTINSDGVYLLALWASVSSDTASALVALTPRINGISDAPTSPVAKQLVKDIGSITTVNGFGFGSFTAGMVIDLGIAADKTCNVMLHESVFHAFRLA